MSATVVSPEGADRRMITSAELEQFWPDRKARANRLCAVALMSLSASATPSETATLASAAHWLTFSVGYEDHVLTLCRRELGPTLAARAQEIVMLGLDGGLSTAELRDRLAAMRLA